MKSTIAKSAVALLLGVFIFGTQTASTGLPLFYTSETSLASARLVWSYGTGGDILDVKPIPDVNLDGYPDVIVGSADNNLYVLNGRTGAKIRNKLTGGDVTSVDFISDVTGDGIPEVVCGSMDGNVSRFDVATGAWVWQKKIQYSLPIYRVHVIPDVTGEGAPDVVAGGISGSTQNIEVLNGSDGKRRWYYPYLATNELCNDFATISDVTGYEQPGIAWSNDYTSGFWVYLFNAATGPPPLFTKSAPNHDTWVLDWRIPDVSGDGFEDIVDIRNDEGQPNGARVRILSGASIEEAGPAFEKSAIAIDERAWDANYIPDMTSDGRPEIAIGWKNMVFVRNAISGSQIWNTTLTAGNSAYSRSHRITEGRDISYDGVGDIVVGVQNGDVNFLNGLNGSSILQPYRIDGAILSIAYIDDVTDDSIPEVLVGAADNFVYCLAPQEKPPQFQSIDWTPANRLPFVYSSVPREGEPVYVEANIVDQGRVDRSLFAYRTSGGSWWNTSMTFNATLDRWTAIIPGQLGGAEVEFFLQALDNVGGRNQSSVYSYTVKALIPGDINGDSNVDVLDLYLFGQQYGKASP